ncbi:hypothetical protein T492DRAFT_855479, partial [Pavlovales sp. CCMP2436]
GGGNFFDLALGVTCDFEHCLANMFFFFVALISGQGASLGAVPVFYNLLYSTLGNIVGAGVILDLRHNKIGAVASLVASAKRGQLGSTGTSAAASARGRRREWAGALHSPPDTCSPIPVGSRAKAAQMAGAAVEAKALRLDIERAAQGDPGAQTLLASRYERDDGVVQDQAEALRLYTQAADQGLAIAQHSLGTCYITGNCDGGAAL